MTRRIYASLVFGLFVFAVVGAGAIIVQLLGNSIWLAFLCGLIAGILVFVVDTLTATQGEGT